MNPHDTFLLLTNFSTRAIDLDENDSIMNTYSYNMHKNTIMNNHKSAVSI